MMHIGGRSVLVPSFFDLQHENPAATLVTSVKRPLLRMTN